MNPESNHPIIIYRFHNNFTTVANRLKLIKKIDPDIPIYGIFGGEKMDYKDAKKSLDTYMEDIFLIPVENNRWKWLHADITYQMWYKSVGRNVTFDMAYVMEWDLLILEKLKDVFPHANDQTAIFTGLIALEKVEKHWYWMKKENRAKVESFYEKVSQYYSLRFTRYACLGPGLCAPRNFFEGLQELKLFEADISDEIKLPVWSQIMGIKPVSNNFYMKWFSFFEMQYFNANVADIELESIVRQLNKKNGRRVFHPFRINNTADILFQQYNKSIIKNGEYSISPPFNVKSIPPLTYRFHCKLMGKKFNLPSTPE